jgi:hypothetical protein
MECMMRKLITAVVGTSWLMGGCLLPAFDSRTSNQGGGTIVTAVNKVTSQQLARLTADELQILADAFSELSPDVNITLTDEQAQAAVDFLVTNEVNSFADVETLANDPDAAEVPESLQAIIDSGIDPTSIIGLE